MPYIPARKRYLHELGATNPPNGRQTGDWCSPRQRAEDENVHDWGQTSLAKASWPFQTLCSVQCRVSAPGPLQPPWIAAILNWGVGWNLSAYGLPSWGVCTALLHWKLWSEGPGARPLHVPPWEQVNSQSVSCSVMSDSLWTQGL